MQLLIERWLQGPRNYTVGCTLYQQFGNNAAIKRLLLQGESSFTKAKLVAAMEALLPTATTPKPVEQAVEEKPVPTQAKGNDAAILAAFEKEWKQLYSTMQYHRHAMMQVGFANDDASKLARYNAAVEVLAIEQQLKKSWAARDHYIATGEVPHVATTTVEIPTDPMALAKRIEAIKKSIRRNKLKAKQYPDKPLYPALVQQYENELQIILKSTT